MMIVIINGPYWQFYLSQNRYPEGMGLSNSGVTFVHVVAHCKHQLQAINTSFFKLGKNVLHIVS